MGEKTLEDAKEEYLRLYVIGISGDKANDMMIEEGYSPELCLKACIHFMMVISSDIKEMERLLVEAREKYKDQVIKR